MRSLTLRCSADDRDRLVADLWESRTTGIIEFGDRLEAFFDDEADWMELRLRYCDFVAIAPEETESDFLTPESAEGEPVELGRNFLVGGGGLPASPGRQPIRLQAEEAFGSGRHESTQLVVEALEELAVAAASVADIGCGSGIVSEVARLLGSERVIACDIHDRSLAIARRQFPAVRYFMGSADAIQTSSADVVVANISARVIDLLAGELVRIARPNGMLVLAGFIDECVPKQFVPERVTHKNEWQCWYCRAELQPAGEYPEQTPQKALQPFSQQWW